VPKVVNMDNKEFSKQLESRTKEFAIFTSIGKKLNLNAL